MFNHLKNKQAQVNLTEYVVIIFIVVGVMTVMGTFVKRALQGRLFDARNYAVNVIKERTKGKYNGNIYSGYEPYYLNTVSLIDMGESTTGRLSKGGAFAKDYNSLTTRETNSETAPPKDAN